MFHCYCLFYLRQGDNEQVPNYFLRKINVNILCIIFTSTLVCTVSSSS